MTVAQDGTETRWWPASTQLRARAWFVDLVVIAAFVGVVGALSVMELVALSVVSTVVYAAMCVGVTRTTFGKAVFGIRICPLTDKGAPRLDKPEGLHRYRWLARAVARTLGGYLVVLPGELIRARRPTKGGSPGRLPHDVMFDTLAVIVVDDGGQPMTPLDRVWAFMDDLLAGLGRVAKDAALPGGVATVLYTVVKMVRHGLGRLRLTASRIIETSNHTVSTTPSAASAAATAPWMAPIASVAIGIAVLAVSMVPLRPAPAFSDEQVRAAAQEWAREQFSQPRLEVALCSQEVLQSDNYWCASPSDAVSPEGFDGILSTSESELLLEHDLYSGVSCVELDVEQGSGRPQVERVVACPD